MVRGMDGLAGVGWTYRGSPDVIPFMDFDQLSVFILSHAHTASRLVTSNELHTLPYLADGTLEK